MDHEASETAATVRVMVLADVRLYREGLTRLLADHPSLEVVGAGPVDAAMLRQIAAAQPDVVLLEAAAACETNIVSDLARHVPATRVVAYGVLDETEQAIRCAELGIGAFVQGDAAGDTLVRTVLDLARDEFRCSPRVSALLMRRVGMLSHAGGPVEPDRLTPREAAILSLIAEGLSNKQIAARLGIKLCTVKNHVHHILDKLQVTRRTQAAARHRGGWMQRGVARRGSGSLYPSARRNPAVALDV